MCGVFRPTRKYFNQMETPLLPAKGCKFWPKLWPLIMSSESSLTCHSYCDTEHQFLMVISEDRWHVHLLSRVYQCGCHYLFSRHVCRSLDSTKFRMRGERSNRLRHCRRQNNWFRTSVSACSSLSVSFVLRICHKIYSLNSIENVYHVFNLRYKGHDT